MQIDALVCAFNEAATVGAVVRGARPHVSAVWVVDDGSTDGTAAAAESAGAHVVRHAENRGKGAAVRTGLAAILPGHGTHVLFLDADLQHDPAEIPRFAAEAARGAGVVIGSRFGDRAHIPRSRYLANMLGSRVLSFFAGVRLEDTQSGYRLVRADLLRRMRVEREDFAIETEILLKAIAQGALLCYVPIHAIYIEGRRSRYRPVADTVRISLAALRFRFSRGALAPLDPPPPRGETSVSPLRNALTVDVEEWFHICGVPDLLPRDRWDAMESRVQVDVRRVLALLSRHDVRATFFVLGYVAERHPALVKEIAAAGHEVASHGMEHVRLYEESPDAFRWELRQSLDLLGGILGERPRGFRAAEWSVRKDTIWALEMLKAEGLDYDSSMTPVKVVGDSAFAEDLHLQETSRGPLAELPPLSKRYWRYLNHAVPLGCGWGLRFIRNGKIRRLVRRKNRSGIPACLVIHPWELDPDPPRVDLPFWHRFCHYARLPRLRRKLPRLLSSLPWGPVGEVIAERRAAGYFERCPRKTFAVDRALASAVDPLPAASGS